ncbi:hypothetical protein B484DRAFT_478420 [Ochromonadaceae sp. CCMP2298]|nr:hypothetical protein B484DRAFT_478420 [Ochromonadaceae sp. CCMP2298]
MADDERGDDEYVNEEIKDLQDEVAKWKAKCKTIEMQKRGSDIALNKTKTEMNSLRNVDKLWKDSAKQVFLNLNDAKASFDAQIDQIVGGLTGISKAGARVSGSIPYNGMVRKVIAGLQKRVASQEDFIMALNGQITSLTAELVDNKEKVDRLSAGIDEEVARLMKPLREKLAESMVLIMKEKAARAHERREIAALWPTTVLMPTLLLRYRAQTDEERVRRVQQVHQQGANRALALEIRANVAESKMWELKYDDYGRAFYEHTQTGQTDFEKPAILTYKPPPGRDDMGNVVNNEGGEGGGLADWSLQTDHKGEVFYRHKKSGDVSYVSPTAYPEIPRGKNRELQVGEAAQTVLAFIKEKVLKHVQQTRDLKWKLEHPNTPEDLRRIAKNEKNKTSEEKVVEAAATAVKEAEDAAEPMDLSIYQYDIETVEMMSDFAKQTKRKEERDPDEIRTERRKFLKDNHVRSFDKDYFVGRTLEEVDFETITLPQLRGVVEELAVMEEKLEKRTERVRDSLKDFSFILMDKLAEQERARVEEEKRALLEREKERREQQVQFMVDQQEEIKLRKEEQKRVFEEEQEARKQRRTSIREAGSGKGEVVEAVEEGKMGEEEEGGAEEEADKQSVDGSATEKRLAQDEGVEGAEEGEGAERGGDAPDRKRRRKSKGRAGTMLLEGAGVNLEGQPVSDDEGSLDGGPSSEVDDTYFLTGETKTDYGALLFSDPLLDPGEQDYPPNLVALSTQLVNFALFCGFTNLDSASSPHDSTLDYSLRLDESRAEHLGRDDDWLSASFFVACSPERLEESRVATRQEYDASVGLMPLGPLDPELVVMQTERGEMVTRSEGHSYTYGTSQVAQLSAQKYEHWKTRQLMCDVVRAQVQQEAVSEAYAHRHEAFKNASIFPPADPASAPGANGTGLNTASLTALHPLQQDRTHPHAIPVLALTLLSASFQTDPPFNSVMSNLLYVQVHIGPCIVRTEGKNPLPTGLRWDNLKDFGRVPANDLQLDECIVEVLDEKPDTQGEAFVGRGHIHIDSVIGASVGRAVDYIVPIINREKAVMGTVKMRLCAVVDEFASSFAADPLNLQLLEVDRRISKRRKIETGLHDLEQPSVISHEAQAGSIIPEAASLSALVSDMRGDGVDFVQMLVGDVGIEQVHRAGFAVGPRIVQNLPNFQNSSAFLGKKADRHRWEVDGLLEQAQGLYAGLEDMLHKKKNATRTSGVELRMRLKKAGDKSEELKREVLKSQRGVAEARLVPPPPKEPVFEVFKEVPHVPKLPVTGGLDSRGKKKKALKSDDLRMLLDQVEGGELDAVDAWPIPDAFFPSQAQMIKLGKAVQARNTKMDVKRKQEEEFRVRLLEAYEHEVGRFAEAEKRRMLDLDKRKKECRKTNLKYDAYMQIVTRAQTECDQQERTLQGVADLQEINDRSKQRCRLARFKHQLEGDRQKAYLENIKKRLLKAVRARRHALSLPATAKTDLEYAVLCRQGETALKALRYEIFECKQLLQTEGLRLRTRFQEELRLSVNELSRLKLSREILVQRDCYDRILERFRYEVVNLFGDLEKQCMLEAEEDDVGAETVDDLGERYKPDKVWRSGAVTKVQRLIDLSMAKINLTEGLGQSMAESQTLLLDVMAVKYGADFLPVRDSWTNQADFERARELLADAVQWTRAERTRVQELQRKTDLDRLDLEMQLSALRKGNAVAEATHETETKTITVCSIDVIDVMRQHLHEHREQSRSRIIELDASIINLSRECQKVREELLGQEMVNADKLKVLWAFIHTLQSAVQQLSGKMEIVVEEKERIVIASKLTADKTKHQLRIERKHTSNLLFIIQSQRGNVKFLIEVIAKLTRESRAYETEQLAQKTDLRRQIWEQAFAFTRLSTDVDALFEFFAARMANLAGARTNLNNQLASNGAALVLGALCKSPRPSIRKLAARALGGMGWDGFVETRILLWDSVMYWKMFKAKVIAKEHEEYESGMKRFDQSGQLDAIITLTGEVEDFVPMGNMSLRTIIKQRRQWSLRAARRREGPNVANQKQLNIRDGVIPSLLQMALKDGKVDWEISRNAALAISIASYEPSNHLEMTQNDLCVNMIIDMCRGGDPEVQTHAAVTIANLCHKDENSQMVFGKSGAIEVLVDLCRGTVVDVLEACTSALSNLTCYSDHNCTRVLEYGGVEVLVRVITHSYSENLLDLDQNDEVQTNAAEMLANVSRFSIDTTVGHFQGRVIDALVIMCASSNKQLRRHVPLVLGNIAQEESCRQEIGSKGGVEALFLVLEDVDTTIQANTLWAMCNLMWHPPNQERAGRFMREILAHLTSPWQPVRVQSMTLIANTLYYNSANRVRFLESEGALETVLQIVDSRPDVPMVEGALRALLSLSYVDAIALWLGETGGYIPMFIEYLGDPLYSRDCMRYSLEILCNLCLHHSNRRIIYENGGIDAIVALHIDVDAHVRELSVSIIDYLQDITPAELMARSRQDLGLERAVILASHADPLVRAVAAETLGEELWMDPRNQARALEVGGVDVLLGIAANPLEPPESLVPALWTLRNLLHGQAAAKAQFGYRDGVAVLNSVLRQGFRGQYAKQAEQVFEAALSVLHTASVGDERNARRLLNVGLPSVLDLAEGRLTHGGVAADHALAAATATLGETLNPGPGPSSPTSQFPLSLALPGAPSPLPSPSTMGLWASRAGPAPQLQQVLAAMKAEGVGALAKALLLQLAPFNYVVCRNCFKRQDLHGTSCVSCGHRLLVDPDVTEIELRRAFERLPLPSTNSRAQNMVLQAQAGYESSKRGLGAAGTFGGFNTKSAHANAGDHGTGQEQGLGRVPRPRPSTGVAGGRLGSLSDRQRPGSAAMLRSGSAMGVGVGSDGGVGKGMGAGSGTGVQGLKRMANERARDRENRGIGARSVHSAGVAFSPGRGLGIGGMSGGVWGTGGAAESEDVDVDFDISVGVDIKLDLDREFAQRPHTSADGEFQSYPMTLPAPAPAPRVGLGVAVPSAWMDADVFAQGGDENWDQQQQQQSPHTNQPQAQQTQRAASAGSLGKPDASSSRLRSTKTTAALDRALAAASLAAEEEQG